MNIEESPSGEFLLGGTAINSIDQVQDMIRKLKVVEENLKKRSQENAQSRSIDSNGNSNISNNSSFESLPLIDLEDFKSFPEDSWLLDVREMPGGVKKGYTRKDNFLDTRLLNIRNSLINTVKAALNEDRANQVSLVRVKRNSSYVVNRETESPEKTLGAYQSPKRPNDVSATYRLPPSSHNSPIACLSPANQQAVMEDMSQISPVKVGQDDLMYRTMTVIKTPQANRYATVTRPSKLGSTFTPQILDFDDEPKTQPDLNTTFTRSSEDEAMSSPISPSTHSPHNISMEELQTKARIQEQSLRMAVPLRRKDTHVIEYHPELNGQVASSPSRTWSTDTYSLAESNPDSGASSGVSSPRDSQSCENVQLVPNTMRRSMPNLALVREGNRGKMSTVMQVMPHHDQIRHQPQYISDSTLALENDRPRTAGPNRYQGVGGNANYNCNSQRQATQEIKRPSYTRGETFYKSNNIQVLKKSPHGSMGITYGEGSQANLGSPVGYVDPRRRNLFGTQKRYSTPIEAGRTGNNATNQGSRTALSLSGGNGVSHIQKPKVSSRIPAPGGRLRYI